MAEIAVTAVASSVAAMAGVEATVVEVAAETAEVDEKPETAVPSAAKEVVAAAILVVAAAASLQVEASPGAVTTLKEIAAAVADGNLRHQRESSVATVPQVTLVALVMTVATSMGMK